MKRWQTVAEQVAATWDDECAYDRAMAMGDAAGVFVVQDGFAVLLTVGDATDQMWAFDAFAPLQAHCYHPVINACSDYVTLAEAAELLAAI